MTTPTDFRRKLLVILLWLAPLVVPSLGAVYLVLKWRVGDPFGPIAWGMLLVVVAWISLSFSVLMIPGWRRGLLSRRGLVRVLAVYFCFGLAACLAEMFLLAADVVWDLEVARPLSLNDWSFAPEPPELDPTFRVDSVHGSRFDRASEDQNFNQQGYRDVDQFVDTDPSLSAGLRILLLGDSFAYGSAAVNDGTRSGFADCLEHELKGLSNGIAVWNTGIPGTGQGEQLLHLRRWLPVMRPNLVMLAFYAGNDFEDNQRPPAQFYVFRDELWANRYVAGTDPARIRTLSPRDAWLRARGYAIRSDPWWLGLRFPTIITRLFRQTRDRLADNPALRIRQQTDLAVSLVDRIRRESEEAGARFCILIIPTRDHVSGAVDQRMMTFKERLIDAGIEVFFPDGLLSVEDYMPAPDLHWTKSGHKRVGSWLAGLLGTDGPR